ncbi:hypothetical protein [Neptuniibacter sp. QD37_11]|uniref:hypothetical protein n=1 Tax=Neptuniibacter sp. QD37_11 TaxID=3398209 RepID=UPI0039F5499C
MGSMIYSYRKTRKQQSHTFIMIALSCYAYIAGLFLYEEHFNDTISFDFKMVYSGIFVVASLVLFAVAWWLRSHPATYEVKITKERFIISYPNSELWSFDVAISDIKRFEYRNTLSHAGQGSARAGILLNDGNFHEVCMNYGANIGAMHKAIRKIRPEIEFPKKLNQKVSGFVERDYDA